MPVRIAGVNLPNKRVPYALRYIYGIGTARGHAIAKELAINPLAKLEDLSEAEIHRLREVIEKRYPVEGELRRQVGANIKRLKEINSYRGIRHAKHLPVRGQRTRTNTRTVRGNVRRTAGSGRKSAAEKT